MEENQDKRWVISVILRPEMSKEEALDWMSKVADVIYETPTDFVGTVGMQEQVWPA